MACRIYFLFEILQTCPWKSASSFVDITYLRQSKWALINHSNYLSQELHFVWQSWHPPGWVPDSSAAPSCAPSSGWPTAEGRGCRRVRASLSGPRRGRRSSTEHCRKSDDLCDPRNPNFGKIKNILNLVLSYWSKQGITARYFKMN